MLDAYISLEDLSAALGVSEKRLAEYNLSLQATIVTGNKHLPAGFEVRVPRAALDEPIEQLVAGISSASWQSEQLPDMYHTVGRGDTLSQIAETYKTRVSTLVALNGLRNSHSIRAGQKLRLPAAGPAPAVVAQAATETVVASVDVTRLRTSYGT